MPELPKEGGRRKHWPSGESRGLQPKDGGNALSANLNALGQMTKTGRRRNSPVGVKTFDSAPTID